MRSTRTTSESQEYDSSGNKLGCSILPLHFLLSFSLQGACAYEQRNCFKLFFSVPLCAVLCYLFIMNALVRLSFSLFVNVPLIFSCPVDHVLDWQPRLLLCSIEAQSITAMNTNTRKANTTTTMGQRGDRKMQDAYTITVEIMCPLCRVSSAGFVTTNQ